MVIPARTLERDTNQAPSNPTPWEPPTVEDCVGEKTYWESPNNSKNLDVPQAAVNSKYFHPDESSSSTDWFTTPARQGEFTSKQQIESLMDCFCLRVVILCHTSRLRHLHKNELQLRAYIRESMVESFWKSFIPQSTTLWLNDSLSGY